MIKGVHTMFYSSKPEELRAFLRDKLGFPCSDVGGGWLIFDLPEADMGCHPADPENGGPSGLPRSRWRDSRLRLLAGRHAPTDRQVRAHRAAAHAGYRRSYGQGRGCRHHARWTR